MNINAHLVGFTRRAHRLLVNDLRALPADSLNVSHQGAARTPLNIVAECGMVNQWVAGFLTTGESGRLAPEARNAFLAAFTDLEKTITYLDECTEILVAALEQLDETTLDIESNQPFNRPMSRLAVAELPAVHMMYHDGQLTFLQTLLGDAESHW